MPGPSPSKATPSSGPQRAVKSTPLGGGNAIEIATRANTIGSAGSLIVDSTAIYWLGGTSAYEIERP